MNENFDPPKVLSERVRRIVVLGSRGVGKPLFGVAYIVGKTSTITQFVENHFIDYYSPTVEHMYFKTVRFNGTDYQFEIQDTAGQDEYSPLSTKYVLGVHGYVMMYSVLSRSSFEMMRPIRDKIVNLTGSTDLPLMLIANKCDLESERDVSNEEGKALAAELKCPYIETSAKLGSNVEQAFNSMLKEVESSLYPPEENKSKCCIQ